jgi:hypothetical protein
MKKNRSIPFAEFQQLLERLGYKLKRTDTGEIFHHPKEGLILFRRYADDESVYPGDLLRTRKFLDLRGLLEEADFDTFMQRANKPA